MGTKVKMLSLFLILCLGACIVSQKASAQGVSVSMQVFYDELSPYGTWVYSPDYGYAWLPDVDPGFSPYATNGYWVFTDDGWTWVSYYSWGWAPFHYGRWYIDPYYGPMWIPDYEWGPGWVTWRRSGDYYGWAPIGPGVSINIAYGNDYYVPEDHWTFVRNRDFGRRDINNYYVNNSNNVTIINNSTVINNTYVDRSRNVTYNAGPDRKEVEQHAGKKITPVAIKETSTPGQHITKSQLQIYRPQVQKNVSSGTKPAPSKVANLQDVKTSPQRTSGTPHQKAQQPAKQQPAQQQQHQDQPAKQQPAQQQQHQDQPAKQQPAQQQQHQDQPAKQQPAQQQQHQDQPAKQQPAQQQQHQDQPGKQQPVQQQQHQDQPGKQQPSKQQQIEQPAKQQSAEPQKVKSSSKGEKVKQPKQQKPPKQSKPPKNTGEEKPPK